MASPDNLAIMSWVCIVGWDQNLGENILFFLEILFYALPPFLLSFPKASISEPKSLTTFCLFVLCSSRKGHIQCFKKQDSHDCRLAGQPGQVTRWLWCESIPALGPPSNQASDGFYHLSHWGRKSEKEKSPRDCSILRFKAVDQDSLSPRECTRDEYRGFSSHCLVIEP